MSGADPDGGLDGRFMARALDMARKSVGSTAPNPAVGAVIVRDGQVLGSGRTQPIGGPHAEVEAIRDAIERGHGDLSGASMYVTLEPCCHWGRTAPCTDAIIEAGLQRVVVGVVDPYPPMQGKGLRRLRSAGVEVDLGVRSDEAAEVVRGFTRTVTEGLPEVTCKVAMSLDGHIATQAGESKWITGADARADGHRLRASHDGILVGIGTVIADDPQLTCRDAAGIDPVPVVLDTQLRVPLAARLLRGPVAPLILCADDAPPRQVPADVLRLPRGPGGVDIEQALRALAARGLHRLLVEGGGRVHRALFDAGLVDTLHVYVAGTLIPGGLPWLGGPPLGELSTAIRLGPPTSVTPLGADVRLTYRVPHGPNDP